MVSAKRRTTVDASEVRAWILEHELVAPTYPASTEYRGEAPGVAETTALLAAFDRWAAKRWTGYWDR
jgi:hypothetical protein